MSGALVLLEHDGAWASRFAAESERLRGAIASHVLAIEHVGSPAVPGLPGKPVLDIAIAVVNESSADACVAPLESLGYEYRGPHGDDPARRSGIGHRVCSREAARGAGGRMGEGRVLRKGPFIQAALRHLTGGAARAR